jgi:hypothetical protein
VIPPPVEDVGKEELANCGLLSEQEEIGGAQPSQAADDSERDGSVRDFRKAALTVRGRQQMRDLVGRAESPRSQAILVPLEDSDSDGSGTDVLIDV